MAATSVPRTLPPAVLDAFFCSFAGSVESAIDARLSSISSRLAYLSAAEANAKATGDTAKAGRIQDAINRLDREQARLKEFLSDVESACGVAGPGGSASSAGSFSP